MYVRTYVCMYICIPIIPRASMPVYLNTYTHTYTHTYTQHINTTNKCSKKYVYIIHYRALGAGRDYIFDFCARNMYKVRAFNVHPFTFDHFCTRSCGCGRFRSILGLHVYVCMHIYICVCVCVHGLAAAGNSEESWAYVCIYVCMHACMYVCM